MPDWVQHATLHKLDQSALHEVHVTERGAQQTRGGYFGATVAPQLTAHVRVSQHGVSVGRHSCTITSKPAMPAASACALSQSR